MAIQGVFGRAHHQARQRESRPACTRSRQTAKASSGGLMDLVIPLIEESLVSPAKDHFQYDGLVL